MSCSRVDLADAARQTNFFRCCAIILFSLSCAVVSLAQAPLCDVTCSPNPGSQSYGGTFAARVKVQNARGARQPNSGIAANSPKTSPTVAGSQSAFYAIPVFSLPGRNGLDLNLTLYYSSAIWTIDVANNTATFNADKDWPSYGFRMGFGYLENSNGTYIWTESDGSKHSLSGASPSYVAQDSSFANYDSSTKTLVTKNGTRWVFEQVGSSTTYRPIKLMDTNGNYISISYSTATGANNLAISQIVDTVGRAVNFIYDSNQRLTSITAPAYGGTPSQQSTVATFTWSTATLKYSFTPQVKDSPANNSTIKVMTSVRYPSNVGYTFIYGDWGLVKEIDQVSASNAIRSYVKWNFPAGTTTQSGSPAYSQETISNGVNAAAWNYVATKTSGQVTSLKVTDPLGNITTTYLGASGTATAGLLDHVTYANPSGTVLKTVYYGWAGTATSNPLLTSVTTTLKDTNQISRTYYSYGDYGNLTQMLEYDYGGQLLRKTQTDYLSDSAYIAQHILDRPAEIRVYDGRNQLVSKTDYVYDNSSLSPVTVAQHDDANYSTSFLTRGNLTGLTSYPDPGSQTGIQQSFTYDQTGNVVQGSVGGRTQVAYTYTAENAYPETVTRGSTPSLSISAVYDFNTGLVTSSTDENQHSTAYTYESTTRRLLSTARPDGSQSVITYDDTSAQASPQTASQIDSSKWLKQVVTVDGLGRVLKTQTQDGSGVTYSVVESQYDQLGRTTKTSNPHATNESPLWTQTQYDALGRVTKIIPPDGTVSSNNTQFAYLGNNVTVTDPASKQRKAYYDPRGRMVQLWEPGYNDGSPATGSVTISGTTGCISTPNPNPPPSRIMCGISDSGTVSVSVGGYTATAGYACVPNVDGGVDCDDSNTVASGLASVFNRDYSSPVTAAVTGIGVITFTAKSFGTAGNSYSLSYATSTDDHTDFPQGSFTASSSGSQLTGGTEATGQNGQAPSLNTPLITYYNYGPTDLLGQVIQGQQQRLNVYDGMGRILSESIPETVGANTTYSYDGYGNLASRTDPKGVVTSYQFDALNRLIGVSYNPDDTPGVTWTYGTSSSSNNNGRLLSMTDATGTESYTSYNTAGLLTAMSKTVGGAAYNLQYGYNYAGQLTQLT